MPDFTVAPIGEAQLPDAYPLVRAFAPQVSYERWVEYARTTRADGGILGLFGADDSLFGLLTYRRAQTLQHGSVVFVDNFVTFELSRSAPGRRALCEAAEALARERGCTAVELLIGSRGYADGSSSKAQGWNLLGHQLTGVVFRKEIGAAGSSASGAAVAREA
jgi:hypothetical protein